MSTQNPPLMTVQDAATYLRMCTKWIYEHQDELKCVRVGRKVLFRQAAIEEYLQRSEGSAK